MSCLYVPQITAEFGKVITDAEINHEFDEIERVFLCFEEQIGSILSQETNIHNYGIIDNSYTLTPAFGVLQYMELQGDVELDLSAPEDGDPRLISLIIANAGGIDTGNYARFNFRNGTVWSADRDNPMDGKPWNMFANLTGGETGTQYEGFYGCVVNCIHDGVGWVYIVFGRHHLNIAGALNPDDIYDWR
jgi:hypothetical protein